MSEIEAKTMTDDEVARHDAKFLLEDGRAPQWVKDSLAAQEAGRETLRDRFAMAALQAIRVEPLHGNEAKVAVAAYAVADAMLEARKR